MKFFQHALVVSFLSLCISESSVQEMSDEEWMKNYFNELKKTYDKRVAPIGENGPGSPIKVRISMWILDIPEVDDSNMDFVAQFYFRQTWTDSRLEYTDRNQSITLNSEEDLWTPDLFFTGAREGRLHQIMHPNTFIRIKPHGEVFLSKRLTVRFPCRMDFRSFPHDVQQCPMRFESYGFTREYIDTEWIEGKKSVGVTDDVTLFNFHLHSLYLSEKTEKLTTGEYKILTVNLTFQRKFGLFAIRLYIPFIILVIVSFLSLWIKAQERGLRLSFLVMILYFMHTISSDISYSIPQAPYTKGTDVWIGFCEFLVFTVFMEFIVVALIAGRNDNGDSESKGNILLNMEPESKDQSLKSDSMKSHFSKFVNMFDARNGGRANNNEAANRIDKIFRIVFPVVFILFNVIYWSVYCCQSTDSSI